LPRHCFEQTLQDDNESMRNVIDEIKESVAQISQQQSN